MEREWAKRLNAAQLESLQKVSDAEKFAAAKAADAEQLAATALELQRASERIRALEAVDEEQRVAARRAAHKMAALEQSTQAVASPSSLVGSDKADMPTITVPRATWTNESRVSLVGAW